MKVRTWMVAGSLSLALAGGAWAAGFSTNANATPGASSGPVTEGTACGSTLLTHSTSQSIVALNSVSCNAGGIHTDNRYFRAYDMSAYPDGFSVCEVQVGIEQASSGGGSQEIFVNVYTNAGAAFPAGTLTLVGTANPDITDQTLTVVPVPLAAAIPAGTTELVVEVFTPNGTAGSNVFFIGSNNLGETGPSYIQAADCGVNAPTPTSSIGFANMQIVLNVSGDPDGGQPPVTEVPTLGTWGLLLLGAVLAGAAFVAIRRRAVA